MVLMMLGAFVVSLAGCNTLKGAGEDIEAGGEAIQDAAD
ncbi:entericidin A/B family lipoprotein [Phycisphaeraceae bacterium D3-23]